MVRRADAFEDERSRRPRFKPRIQSPLDAFDSRSLLSTFMASLLRPAARVATRAISRTTPVRAFIFSRGLPITHRAVYRRWNSTSATPPALDTNTPQQQEQPTGTQTQEPRLSITFTCTANDCGHRSSHEFTKRAYTTGYAVLRVRKGDLHSYFVVWIVL